MERRLARALAALAFLGLAQGALAGWWDDLDKGANVTLNDLIARPDAFRSQILTFPCLLHGKDEVFAPLATPFNPTRHDNVAVWPDGTAVWDQDGYKRSFPFLYIEKSHPQRDALLQLEPFTRIEVTGRIRTVYRNRPFVEITAFRQTGHRVGKDVVTSVMAGDRFAEGGDMALAYENYRRALRPDLPPSYDLLVRSRVGDALRKLGRLDDARRVEGGEILGGQGVPEAVAARTGPTFPPPGDTGTLGDPLPGALPPAGTAPRPFESAEVGPSPLSTDLPGTPAVGSPLTDDLPGMPSVAPAARPPTDAPPAAAPRAPAAAPGDPFAEDLPGELIDPRTARPPAARPRPEPRPPVRAAEVPPPDAVPRAGPVPGAPPRRSPRLSGVK